jgi:ribonuclease BN (tRNA processing enzyme)
MLSHESVILTNSMRESPNSPAPVNLTFLGTGDAFASQGRFQSGYLIEADGCHILMEAGPTVLCAMKRMGVAPADIDIILISHLHGDHFGGLPFLLLEYLWESPRRKPLKIAGPARLEERTWLLFNTMFPFSSGDVERVKRNLEFVKLDPAHKARFGKVEVDSLRVPHMKRDLCLAFKIAISGKTIAYSGDTGWVDDLVSFTAGADLFLCECTYFDNPLGVHLSYPLLESKRRSFDVKRMMLTHIGREVLERSPQLNMELAADGMRVEV